MPNIECNWLKKDNVKERVNNRNVQNRIKYIMNLEFRYLSIYKNMIFVRQCISVHLVQGLLLFLCQIQSELPVWPCQRGSHKAGRLPVFLPMGQSTATCCCIIWGLELMNDRSWDMKCIKMHPFYTFIVIKSQLIYFLIPLHRLEKAPTYTSKSNSVTC